MLCKANSAERAAFVGEAARTSNTGMQSALELFAMYDRCAGIDADDEATVVDADDEEDSDGDGDGERYGAFAVLVVGESLTLVCFCLQLY